MTQTGDITWMVFLLVYGIDGCCTIVHRVMLHENLGEAHRKHAYQLMCNELKVGHVKISLLYMFLQLAVSLGFVYLCPSTVLAHWIYLIVAGIVLAGAFGTKKELFFLRRVKTRKRDTEILYIFFGTHTANTVLLTERLIAQEMAEAA